MDCWICCKRLKYCTVWSGSVFTHVLFRVEAASPARLKSARQSFKVGRAHTKQQKLVFCPADKCPLQQGSLCRSGQKETLESSSDVSTELGHQLHKNYAPLWQKNVVLGLKFRDRRTQQHNAGVAEKRQTTPVLHVLNSRFERPWCRKATLGCCNAKRQCQVLFYSETTSNLPPYTRSSSYCCP